MANMEHPRTQWRFEWENQQKRALEDSELPFLLRFFTQICVWVVNSSGKFSAISGGTWRNMRSPTEKNICVFQMAMTAGEDEIEWELLSDSQGASCRMGC